MNSGCASGYPPEVTTEELAHQITMAGLEVDAIEPVAGDFSGVVVAEIMSAEPHPDADKLRVCQVSAGSESLQIVCGAPNARRWLERRRWPRLAVCCPVISKSRRPSCAAWSPRACCVPSRNWVCLRQTTA